MRRNQRGNAISRAIADERRTMRLQEPCPSCNGTQLTITYPSNGSYIGHFDDITGTAKPCSCVRVCVDDDLILLRTHSDFRGNWSAHSIQDLPVGEHKISACCENCMQRSVTSDFHVSLTPPVFNIVFCGTEYGARPVISGTGIPGCTITLTFSWGLTTDMPVSPDGRFYLRPRHNLKAGVYSVSAYQTDRYGGSSGVSNITFSVSPNDRGEYYDDRNDYYRFLED